MPKENSGQRGVKKPRSRGDPGWKKCNKIYESAETKMVKAREMKNMGRDEWNLSEWRPTSDRHRGRPK